MDRVTILLVFLLLLAVGLIGPEFLVSGRNGCPYELISEPQKLRLIRRSDFLATANRVPELVDRRAMLNSRPPIHLATRAALAANQLKGTGASQNS